MKIKLNEISTAGLLRLLRDAAAELESRQSSIAPQAVEKRKGQVVEHDPKMAALLHAPDAADADFCLMIAARIRGGGYVKASEREHVAEIAQSYPLWVARQGLPTTHNAGDWKRGAERASAPSARER